LLVDQVTLRAAPAREKAYMQVVVNGQNQAVPDGSNLAQLLEQLALEPRRVAVELNKRLVPRGQFGLTALGDNDQLEIVTLVGGG